MLHRNSVLFKLCCIKISHIKALELYVFEIFSRTICIFGKMRYNETDIYFSIYAFSKKGNQMI